MEILHTFSQFEHWKQKNDDIAFVPTMGALHKGHFSLVEAAKKTGKKVLVSIFVNPTQFAPHEDFSQYPRSPEEDVQHLEEVGADAVWFPSCNDIYPEDKPLTIPPLPDIFFELEGAVRPTHFLGVAQVLFSFFSLIRPKMAFFGQKDYQQTLLVKWLVNTFSFPVEIRVIPIVREKSGLALSSRNAYLSPTQRVEADVLFRALSELQQKFSQGEKDLFFLLEEAKRNIEVQESVSSIDYLDIRNAKTLAPFSAEEEERVVLAAIRIGGVRLLDNIMLL